MSDTRAPSPAAEPEARQALRTAFAELALNRRYRDFGVAEIVRAARVARSTFYYHFAGKDDLLLANLKPLVDAMAAMPHAPRPSPELERWVAHIWERRGLACRLLAGPAGRRLEASLAAQLRQVAGSPAPPRRIGQAEQIAGASFGLLSAWVGHRVTATPAELAQALWRGARSLTGAMIEAN